MLTFVNGCPESFCDGVSRRSFLRAGGLALGGLALSDFLRLKAQGAVASGRGKSIIMICLARIFHTRIEQRSGGSVTRLVFTEPNETANHRFFFDTV